MMIDLLIAADSQTADWSIFLSMTPDSPDRVIIVQETTPIILGKHQVNGQTQELYAFQITVRSEHHEVNWSRVNLITTTIESVLNQVVSISSSVYNVHGVIRASGPIHVGKNKFESKRDLHTINYLCSISQVS